MVLSSFIRDNPPFIIQGQCFVERNPRAVSGFFVVKSHVDRSIHGPEGLIQIVR